MLLNRRAHQHHPVVDGFGVFDLSLANLVFTGVFYLSGDLAGARLPLSLAAHAD
jgi:hypothetical protein